MTIRHACHIFGAILLGTLLCTSVSAEGPAVPAEVRIGVLSLFHPRALDVSAIIGSALVIHAAGQTIVLERSSGLSTAHVVLSENQVLVTSGSRTLQADRITIEGRQHQPVDFVLAVPHRISRRYRGRIEIIAESSLVPIVVMDREAAVASIVAAESLPGTPLEAVKAQAVAARSYLFASLGRHPEFDFCDTTHCQFMRELPKPDSNAMKATEATRGLVLAYDSRPFGAMYTRSCSGNTYTPSQVGLPSGPYPYYSVECVYCRAHPQHWESTIPASYVAELRSMNESERLRLVCLLGSDAAPSNDFVITRDGDLLLLRGVGEGHGIGLCQAGAKAMAAAGADFRQILVHYYPNTSLQAINEK